MTNPSLTTATLTPHGEEVAATWTVDAELPSRGTWLLSTTLVGGEHGPTHQFGIKFLDDKLIGYFVFDHVVGSQYKVQGEPQRTSDTWTARFPAREFGVATAGTWKATLNVEGRDLSSISGSM